MRVIALIIFMAISANSHAVLISTSIGDFEITERVFNPNLDRSLLPMQPWWGDEALALEFATALGDRVLESSGISPGIGLLFAYEKVFAQGFEDIAFAFYDSGSAGINGLPIDLEAGHAIASRVPEPSTLILLVAGVMILRKFRQSGYR